MNIIEPSVELMRTGLEVDFVTPEQFIEKVGRTCYKSEDKITADSAAKFVGNLIKRGHYAMIEHYSLIFKTEALWYEEFVSDYEMLLHKADIALDESLRPYLRFTDTTIGDASRCIVSGNMRAWRDFVKACIKGFGFVPGYLYGVIRNYPIFFSEYQDYVPAIVVNDELIPIKVSHLLPEERKVHQDVTVKFVCDRGVSHEIVRHRVASFAQESTRYCNYGQDKFGNEITVVRPSWCKSDTQAYKSWEKGCKNAEKQYFDLIDKHNCVPQEARSVLPNSLKTEIIVTMNLDGWNHFFGLRCAPDAQPDMQEAAKMARRLFTIENIFNDKKESENA